MRKIVGAVLLIVAAIPMAFLPVVIVWGVLECGPVNSSCHHPPYRLAVLVIGCLAIAALGGWLVIGPRRPRELER